MFAPAIDLSDPTGWPALVALMLFGLLGGGHCIGMCGGIIAALERRARTVPIVSAASLGTPTPISRVFAERIAWSAGRIVSYALAGAIAGTAGSTLWILEHVLPVQKVAFVGTSLAMLVLGLQLIGVSSVGVTLERLGRWVWPIMQPAARSSLRLRGLPGAVVIGMAWGWVPCGMVYGALALALMSGSPSAGALVMLAFGLGTLPALFGLGWIAEAGTVRFRSLRARRATGAVIILFAMAGLVRLDPISGLRRLGDFCLNWAV